LVENEEGGKLMPDGYDVIGDVHGHADELKSLLAKLGYEERGGAFRHSARTAIFIGDYIDRGLANMEVVRIVRSMVDAGSAQALMGNHEYNAIGYHTPNPEEDGSHLRRHIEKNVKQHKAFLDEQLVSPGEAADALKWFRSLPILIEADGAQFAHAAWHQPTVNMVKPLLNDDFSLPEAFLLSSFEKDTEEDRAIETLLKGPEYRLLDSFGSFKDKDGNERTEIRLAWWKSPPSGTQLGLHEASVGVPDGSNLANELVPAEAFDGYDNKEHANATFFGHYWMTGTPRPLAPNIACVDYSVAKKGGQLFCYRWEGERLLNSEKFVGVRSSANEQP
jgi:hypothetical protein